METDRVQLRLADRVVADYELQPQLEPTLSPRPYLHPVRTLGGTVVTDAMPADHRWHLGASLAVQDVAGTNLWGGRTYVRGAGYTWRQDHGRIAHIALPSRADDRLVQQLHWCDPTGAMLLDEQRALQARLVPGHPEVWALDISYTLTAPADRDIVLGSPATNGRPGGAGYGGFFWRAALTDPPPETFTAAAVGEEAVNGSTAPWVALTSSAPHPYTLVFTGLADGDRWFVRTQLYPGVCAAFAFHTTRTVAAGSALVGRHRVLIADGVLTAETAGQLAAG